MHRSGKRGRRQCGVVVVLPLLATSPWALAQERGGGRGENADQTQPEAGRTAPSGEDQVAKDKAKRPQDDRGAALIHLDLRHDEIEEIIVTTERRRQDIQKVAGSVQAFTAVDLQTNGVGFEFRNLQVVVPGLHITNQEGQIEVFLRGIGSTNNDFSSDPAVATHYNGVYLSRPRGIGPMFFDVERVEINKGPQGTLRGRNATAGTVNIISRRPDLLERGGYVRAGLGNFSADDFEAVVNVPLLDSLAVRGAVFQQRHSPYYTNALGNGVEAPGREDDLAFRVSALWQPTDRLSAHILADMAKQRGTGYPGQFWGGALSAGYDVQNLKNPREQFFLQEGQARNDIGGVVGVLTYEFDPVIAEYTGGYRTYAFYNKNAQRPFQQGVNYPGVDITKFNLDSFSTFYQLEESNSLVQELRFYSPDSSWLWWTAGGFYYRENFARVSWDFTDQTLVQNNLGGQSVTLPDSHVASFAAYGDGTINVTDRLRIKAGARLTNEVKREVGFQAQYAFGFGPNVTAQDVRAGTPGFALRFPSELKLTDPGSHDPAAQFLDAIASFGARDTLDDFIANTPGSVSVTTTGPSGKGETTYRATYPNWRAALEYDLTADNMLYTMVSTGTRSGGINPTVTLPDGSRLPVNFEPEQLLAAEVGAKNRFVPVKRPMLVNVNAFFYRYADQVLQTMVAARGSGGSMTEQQNFLTNANVGNSKLFGLELSGHAPFPLGFHVGWNA